jgi:hypothetical protein
MLPIMIMKDDNPKVIAVGRATNHLVGILLQINDPG